MFLAGATELYCHADLDEPVVRATDAHWLSMNGIITITNNSRDKHTFTCTFNYFREDASEFVPAGTYAILAMVMGIRKREDNPPSTLRGDIISLTRLGNAGNAPYLAPRLIVTGHVCGVNRVEDSFKVTTFQWIEGATARDELTIVGFFKRTNRWPIPNSRMPNARGLIAFSGSIQDVRNTTVTLFVDMINYLNKHSRPSIKSLAARSKLTPISPHRRPSLVALRNAKRTRQSRETDDAIEAFFKKEREFYSPE
ncbi:hypothetical protein V8E53_001493 [Lactarius tabidus]